MARRIVGRTSGVVNGTAGALPAERPCDQNTIGTPCTDSWAPPWSP